MSTVSYQRGIKIRRKICLQHAPYSAFTLVELLVVIAVITILAALLLPALTKAKSRAMTIECMNNLKQLATSWHAYTLDNGDVLVLNNSVDEVPTSSDPNDTNASDIIGIGTSWTLDHPRTDTNPALIQAGLLYPYNTSVAIYHCPADNSVVEDLGGNPLPINQLRTRSYNMSQSLNGAPSPSLMNIPCFEKFSQIQNPNAASCFVFLDVLETEILDAEFGMPTAPDYPNPNQWWDIPANRHDQGANFAFADGHVEHWRWVVPKTYQGWAPQNVPPAEEPDYQKVRSGMLLNF